MHAVSRAARSVDTSLVVRNWLFGWYIVEFENGAASRADQYGKELLPRLSHELRSQGLKGVSTTSLKQCRSFYLEYREIGQTASDQSPSDSVAQTKIRQTLSAESLPGRSVEHLPIKELVSGLRLGWSHYVELLAVSQRQERRFYEIEAIANSWGVCELRRQIASSLYERLALSRDKEGIRALAKQGLVVEKVADVIKNPLVLEFLGLEERHTYSENDLETAIIGKLQQFLLELGKGFLFEARQKRFTFDNDHFYVDLIFYNRLLRSYVLIDLKRDRLTHQDLGQMQMYVNHFDRHVKTDDESPTIGIVLCHSKNNALVELTLPTDSNIYATQYQLYLPSKEELRQKLLAWVEEVEG